eukprot:227417-Pelagomonas_calceolata.AAC.1
MLQEEIKYSLDAKLLLQGGLHKSSMPILCNIHSNLPQPLADMLKRNTCDASGALGPRAARNPQDPH